MSKIEWIRCKICGKRVHTNKIWDGLKWIDVDCNCEYCIKHRI